MTKKRRVLALLVGVAALGVGVLDTRTCVVRGFVRGEAFFRGRPSSYWGRELEGWSEDCSKKCWVRDSDWVRTVTSVPPWLSGYVAVFAGPRRLKDVLSEPPLLEADPRVVGVLIDLLGLPDERVRILAALSASRLGAAATPAVAKLLAAAQNDPAPSVRTEARWALPSVDPSASKNIPVR